jgi:large subunit ribosomal protein L18
MKVKTKADAKLRRKLRVRKKIRGTTERPRLNVSRTLRYIYGQIIDDDAGVTLVAASSLKGIDTAGKTKVQIAREVGKKIASLALEKGITQVVFDRGGMLYHGRVKAFAEGAREGGLKF